MVPRPALTREAASPGGVVADGLGTDRVFVRVVLPLLLPEGPPTLPEGEAEGPPTELLPDGSVVSEGPVGSEPDAESQNCFCDSIVVAWSSELQPPSSTGMLRQSRTFCWKSEVQMHAAMSLSGHVSIELILSSN